MDDRVRKAVDLLMDDVVEDHRAVFDMLSAGDLVEVEAQGDSEWYSSYPVSSVSSTRGGWFASFDVSEEEEGSEPFALGLEKTASGKVLLHVDNGPIGGEVEKLPVVRMKHIITQHSKPVGQKTPMQPPNFGEVPQPRFSAGGMEPDRRFRREQPGIPRPRRFGFRPEGV